MQFHQIDCFNKNMKFWKILAIWPGNRNKYYTYYCFFFFVFFIVFFDLLFSLNFFFLPQRLDSFIEEMIFYFSELAVTSKVLTFHIMRKNIIEILEVLESKMFQADTEYGIKIVNGAKNFNIIYWKIVAFISVTAQLVHALSPIIIHLFTKITLELPLSSYSFFPEEFKQNFIYPLYFYQICSEHFHMLYNVNIDTFIVGVLILIIAQLDILGDKLSNLTNKDERRTADDSVIQREDLGLSNKHRLKDQSDDDLVIKLNQCIVHFDEIGKFCNLVEKVFSLLLFTQFSMASCIICVCLFRFTLPAPGQYYMFLATYTSIMILQIMVPCWFGTCIMDKSFLLSSAVYRCDWTPRSRRFKSNMRLFVERVLRSLSITGGKMFPLSLVVFTSIMNSAYSFFTLLRHIQSQQI